MNLRKCLLSVAMIVKDEEHNIRRALESVKDIADEIIVVDTGSKDRTPEIAREYTDKVYFHQWKNDFSEARNYSLKFPTCEWVLIFDADEEASENFRKNIRDFLENLPNDVNTVYVPTLSYLDWDFKRQEIASTPRIFRNGTVYYKNIVHNQPVYKPKIAHFPHEVLHYGYIWTRKLKKKKYQRTKNLIVEFLKECDNPVDKLYYLVQLYKTETTGGKPWMKYKVGWQILEELDRSQKLPAIIFEFLYLFGIEAILHDYRQLGEELLKKAMKSAPNYPDPYFGMMVLGERIKDWDMVIEYGEKFIDVLEKTMKDVEKFTWTIMTMKERGTVYALLARAYFEKENLDKFKEYVGKALERFDDKSNNIIAMLGQIFENLNKASEDFYKALIPTLKEILKFSHEKRVILPMRSFLVRLLEDGIDYEDLKDLIPFLNPHAYVEKLILKRLESGEDLILEFFTRGKDLEDFVLENGVPALIFVFDVLKDDKTEELMKILNKLRRSEDPKISGISLGFLGDLYLKSGKIKEAIMVYKRSVEVLPEISQFVKPIIEDLKLSLDKDIEGVYEEIVGYFSRTKDIIYEFALKYDKRDLEILHLLSDHPFATYISAIASDDDEKKRNLLLKIVSKSDLFPFYYYHLAKTYERDDLQKAMSYHIKACESNEYVGDLKLKKYLYDGFYPIRLDITQKIGKSEIVWVGNLSEKFPTAGVINPVRAWKKWEDKYVSYPFPSDEAVKLFNERSRSFFKRVPFVLEKVHIHNMLKHVDWEATRIHDAFENIDSDHLKSVLQDFGVIIDESSKNLLIVSGVEFVMDLKEIVGNSLEIVMFFWVPDVNDREDLLWYYPPFRVLRATSALSKELDSIGYKILDVEVLGKNLRGLYAKKRGKR